MRNMKPKHVLQKLVAKAWSYSYWDFMRGSVDRKYKPRGEPGELVMSLPEEERKLLRELKSEDVQVRTDIEEIQFRKRD